MGYKLLKLITAYPAFTESFLSEIPYYEQLSYQELYDRLVGSCYALSTILYSRYMSALGNEALDLFVSIETLQKAWAQEHGVKYNQTTWLRDIVCAQVRSYQPDVIYLQDLYLFDPAFRQLLRSVIGKKVILVGWRASPTSDFGLFGDLDLFLTCLPHYVQTLRNHGTNAAFFPIAFEPALCEAVDPAPERNLDLIFAGSLFMDRDFHHQGRYFMIDQLIRHSPLQLWTNLYDEVHRSFLDNLYRRSLFGANKTLAVLGLSEEQRKRLPFLRRGTRWHVDPTALARRWAKYADRIHQAVFGRKYFELLARSRIVLNYHIDSAGPYAGNIRLYEATGMGACLLTDWKVNLPELFEPETEVVTYRSADECLEKVQYLLSHEEERKAIAQAGQQRTLRDHTNAQRVEALNRIILELLDR